MQYMRYRILFVLLLSFLLVQAQNSKDLNQAKLDLKNKEYSKALPIFEAERMEKPTDPSLNLSYGICLVETGGDLNKAEECLLIAAKRNLPESYLYLADIYLNQYKITEADAYLNKYAKLRPKERETTLRPFREKLDLLDQAISRTEDIQIIDSLVVDKKLLLSAYQLSPELGQLCRYKDFFGSTVDTESVIFENQKGLKIYFGDPDSGSLVRMDKLLSGFGNEKLPLSDDNFGLMGEVSFPFLLSDGLTLYFSAKSENWFGGYDIYVTRYDMNRGVYLTPERLNMPFNSLANDYLYVYDEIKGVGWFATDRFQPEGLVCVYTFIPNEEVILVENDDPKYIERRARIASIKDSWKPTKDYRSIVAKAREYSNKQPKVKSDDVGFILNDDITYHHESDFKNTEARSKFRELQELKKKLASVSSTLESKRIEYSNTVKSNKDELSDLIQDLERLENMFQTEVCNLEIQIRSLEASSLTK